ncbi:hypothetical protein GCM10028833_00030 [Glycomyces tarimensis]
MLGGRETAMREHLEMVDAMQAGDAERQAELLRQHLSTARDQLTAARINPRGPGDPDLTSLLGSRARRAIGDRITASHPPPGVTRPHS